MSTCNFWDCHMRDMRCMQRKSDMVDLCSRVSAKPGLWTVDWTVDWTATYSTNDARTGVTIRWRLSTVRSPITLTQRRKRA